MACYDVNPYTCTYDSNAAAGKDYTSLATWETDSEADISGYASRVILDCYDSQDHDDVVVMNDADNNATETLHRVIRSASACSTPFAGKKNTGANFTTVSTNTPFNLSEPHCRLEQVVASLSRNTASECNVVYLGYDNAKIVNIVIENSTNIGAGEGNGIKIVENNNLAYNCIIYACKTSGIEITVGTGESAGAVCCTAVGNTVNGFMSAGSGTAYAFNCYGQDNGTEFTEADWDAGDWNASKADATADLNGTATYYYNSKDWSGSLDGDYLATASLDADAGGVGDSNCGKNPVDDLSGSFDPDSFFTGADALFALDISGRTRPAGTDAVWDVGASEYVAAGGLSIPIVIHHRRHG